MPSHYSLEKDFWSEMFYNNKFNAIIQKSQFFLVKIFNLAFCYICYVPLHLPPFQVFWFKVVVGGREGGGGFLIALDQVWDSQCVYYCY